MKAPSEKQVKYANDIAHNLNIDLPKEYTAKAYYDFINEHKDENIELISDRQFLMDVGDDLINEVYDGIQYW